MLVLLFFGVLCALIYFFIVWNNSFWKEQNIPHETPIFLFGNLKDVLLGRKHFGEVYRNLYRKFENDKYIGFYKLRIPSLIIRDPELIKTVLVKDFASFSENDIQIDSESDPIWAANIFNQSGETWKKNRSAWTIGMTSNKIKATYDAIDEKANIMVDYIKEYIEQDPNNSIDAKEFVSNYFTDTIATSVFGMESNSFHKLDNPFRKITKSMFVSSFWENVTTLLYVVAPALGNLLKIRFVPKRAEVHLMAVAQKILESRKKEGFQKMNPFDSILLHIKHQENLQDIDVAGYLFSFLLDGTETSSGVTAYILHSLAKNPQMQDRLRSEIENAAEKSDGKLSYEEVNTLKYLDMVLSETLRLYTPNLSIQRICTKPFKLPASSEGGQEFIIPVGMPVIIPILALHSDSKYHPDPDKFDPERFSENNKDNIEKYTYLPFGDGPRHCIGSRLAMNQIKVCVVALVKNFEIRLTKEMLEKPLKIDPNFFVMNVADGIHITLQNRKIKDVN